MKVLLVDDDEMILKVVGRVLTREGYQVETANEFECGYKKALSGQPDVVISDYDMPDGNGLELFERLQQSGELPDTNFVLMSGHYDTKFKMQQVKNKFTMLKGFLQKPFTISELKALLD